MKRKDPLTGEEFIPKKETQRFAKPENRVKFNNQRASKLRKERSFIDKPLHQNHKILIELLNKKDELIVHEEYLLGKGYNFNIITHYDIRDGNYHSCVYEFIIITLKNNQIKIIRND